MSMQDDQTLTQYQKHLMTFLESNQLIHFGGGRSAGKVHAFKMAAAFNAGFDAGRHRPNTTNCHFRYFASAHLKEAWERGYAKGKEQP